ncbi:uncharacterized protein LOC132756304 [Ruditapes philippinarum]|uniref:uncharacterized protein LOC132756304 n=1 Tax=Ruditapes philippinarum TaxID=129788 RepID=UPI00295C0E88|nr:uncharacterized protein LOC132756304 [Ruditapes philippinarum]
MSGYFPAIALTILILSTSVDSRVWLEAPAIANCRGDTVLTCHYCDTPLTTRTWSRKIGDVWEIIMENGTQTSPSGRLSIREEINGCFSLIISGADNMAAGIYRCGINKYQSAGVEFLVECKPENVEVRLTVGMLIEIRMNTVYPVPDIHFMLTDAAKRTTQVLFSYPSCSGHSWLQDCVWVSTSTFSASQYTYEIVAKTMTETYFSGAL